MTLLPKITRPIEGGPAPCKQCGRIAPLFNIHISYKQDAEPAAGPWCKQCVDQYDPNDWRPSLLSVHDNDPFMRRYRVIVEWNGPISVGHLNMANQLAQELHNQLSEKGKLPEDATDLRVYDEIRPLISKPFKQPDKT